MIVSALFFCYCSTVKKGSTIMKNTSIEAKPNGFEELDSVLKSEKETYSLKGIRMCIPPGSIYSAEAFAKGAADMISRYRRAKNQERETCCS
jgi:hypothetical protein